MLRVDCGDGPRDNINPAPGNAARNARGHNLEDATMTKIDNINTFATREEAEAELARRERAAGLIGFGEILDEGEMGRAEVESVYGPMIVADEDMEAAIDKYCADNIWDELFGAAANPVQRPTRDEARARIMDNNARYRELIAAAPAETTHVWRVCD